jgi:hypothetical protein
MINKPNLTEEELQSNYEEFIGILKKNFSGDRLKKLLLMYSEKELGMELCIAPASMCDHFHNCFPGGYILHVNNVINFSIIQKKVYEMAGCDINFTDEELIFTAHAHDLGKLGSSNMGPYYVIQDEEWKSRKGEIYKMNPNIQYMEVSDRTFYNLQYYGIKITWKEWLGLRLADGMYSESAVKYLKQFNQDMYLRTNLPRIVHMGDYLATRQEFDSWKYSSEKSDMDKQ